MSDIDDKNQHMLISIVTPSYNQAHFIRETIDSVLQQPGPLELFVIDGGSTDGTLEILEEYAKQYKNFNYISEPDKGQSDAINKGLAKCRGSILAYINSDDVYIAECFSKVRKYFAEHEDIDWLYGKYRIIDEQGRVIRKLFTKIKHFAGRKYTYRKLLRVNIIPQPSTFWRKEVYLAAGGFDINDHLAMDYEYWCRIGKQFKACQVDFPVSLYRFYNTSKSGSSYLPQYRHEYQTAKRYAAGRYPFTIFLHWCNLWRNVAVLKLLQLLGR